MTIDGYPHLDRDARGVPYIAGTRMKVQYIAQSQVLGRLQPEQVQRQYPNLTLAQIHCALAYYFDHRDEIDEFVGRGQQQAEALRPLLEDPEAVARLRAIKRTIADADEP
jgi:uncharacterized protein (DUF433 family)